MDDSFTRGVRLLLAGLDRDDRVELDDPAFEQLCTVVRHNLRTGESRLRTLDQKQEALRGLCERPDVRREHVWRVGEFGDLGCARTLLANPTVGAELRAGLVLDFHLRHPRQLSRLLSGDPAGEVLAQYVTAPGVGRELFVELYAWLAGASAEEREIALALLSQAAEDLPRRAREVKQRTRGILEAATRLAG